MVLTAGFLGFIVIEPEVVSAAGVTIYVDDSNMSGTEDGSLDYPYNTIQEGVNAANPGDTVFVFNGTYIENVMVDKTINLTGEDREMTIIDGARSGDGVGITVDWVNITGFTITNSSTGIRLFSSNNNIITGNNVSNHWIEGIYLVSSSNNNMITGNNVSDCSYGIYLDSSSNNNITYNNISNSNNGIYLGNSVNNNITGNNVSDNSYGIYLVSSSNNNITYNNISNNNDCIYLWNSVNNNITGNNVSDSSSGIYLDSSSNNNITCNNISKNSFGIRLQDSSYNNIRDNGVFMNSMFGIGLVYSKSITLVNNTMLENGIYITGADPDVWSTHSIDTSNTVNGKPVIYWKNQNTRTIPPGAGQVILANCTNVKIENQIVIKGSVGYQLGFSNNNYIANNTASNNRYGIHLYFSEYNDLINNTVNDGNGFYFYHSSNNTLTSNNMSYNSVNGILLTMSCNYNTIINNDFFSNAGGISLAYSSGNTVKDNRFSNNLGCIGIRESSSNNNIINNKILNNWEGISLRYSSDNNIIIKNHISNNIDGIYLISSDQNNIINNLVSDNSNGIYITSSSSNNIYHNNIINNQIQAYDDTNNGNQWDNGYSNPFNPDTDGGNYWSDFDEPSEGAYDDYRGPNQDMGNSDGIVDKGLIGGPGKNPYVIDSDSQDNYPLMFSKYMYLYEGWNLISLPLIQSDTKLSSVLSSIQGSYDAVQWYNASDKLDSWEHNHTAKPQSLNDLDTIDHRMGFWIHIIEPGWVIFEYSGAPPMTSQGIQLYKGWNLVGYPSLTSYNRTDGLNNTEFGTHIDVIYWYDASTRTWHSMGNKDHFERGRGYWVHASEEIVWQVPL